MHNNDMIHGDLKPPNFLFDYNYNAIIIDYGT